MGQENRKLSYKKCPEKKSSNRGNNHEPNPDMMGLIGLTTLKNNSMA